MKKDTKAGMVIITIICVIGIVLAIYSLLNGYKETRLYSRVCTETTFGSYVRTAYHKGTAAKEVVQFEYNGYIYKAEGNRSALKGVSPDAVPVHFNPMNPTQAYCGSKPYNNATWELVFLILLSVALVFDVKRMIKVFKEG